MLSSHNFCREGEEVLSQDGQITKHLSRLGHINYSYSTIYFF